MTSNRQCNYCGKKTEQEVVCKLTAAGNDTYSWYCHTCGRLPVQKNGGQWIKKADLAKAGIDMGSIRDLDAVTTNQQPELGIGK